ncbi:uncharacterized protein LOC113388776 [Ctenocephalides felis]|uniref:uncharacterized protein LOC113388776 n=1 Tax=Ctenocephalides felis TaxID=7515 RepID=UPI000E6E2B32|nr:uncharacterized protein LOC113388776 [Ctenocephalides felis]
MAHKRSLEALDKTLKYLHDNQNIFGRAMILLSGDFRQTLPVIPRSTVADELNIFAVLQTTKEGLSQCVFSDINQQFYDLNWLSERTILAAKNKDVDDLNATIQSLLPGECFTYKSVDTATNQDDILNYPTEFLNSLELPGLPPHNLKLKVGSLVIMLRNLNQPILCNGTRLVVKKLINNVIVAKIIKGKYKGQNVLIPRIPMIPTDLPFDFRRLQFPIRLAFAMSINKSQGQSLQVCGINLEFPCFAHGQSYVACLRVGKPSSLFIYAPQKRPKYFL